jgi:predicted short-subunit dehydrogenase-like oxidoreductase (DUF2520 family)
MQYLQIGVVGAGNLGNHLARAFEEAGHHVPLIYSRHLVHAQALASALFDAQPTDNPDFSEFELDIVVACVSDDALVTLSEELRLPEGCLLAHTSGSRTLQEISAYPGPKAVFYPLQTFSRRKPIRFEGIPLCIEADSEEAEELVYTLASSLSKEIYWMSHPQRLALHVAAVFANNFTNHMLTLAANIVEGEDMQFKLLRPLIRETVEKALILGPTAAQTGPAIRGDETTMALHKRYLGDNRELFELYDSISQSIQDNA